MKIKTGLDVLGNGSIGGKLTIGSTNISSETINLNGAQGTGMRVENTSGYISIAPLNSSWAHIYTDQPKFIFNKAVYTTTGEFSSYTGDLLLQRAGSNKLKIGDAGSEFYTTLIARSYDVGATTVIETDGKIDYDKIKNLPVDFKPAVHNHDERYYTKSNLQSSGQSLVHYGNITNMPSSFPPAEHNHDGIYYTRTEIDANIYKKSQLMTSGQSSVHWNNLTSKPDLDNYQGFTLKANSEATGLLITSKSVLDIKGVGGTVVSRIGGAITISSTNDNNYLTGVTGNGNSTVTFTRQGLSNVTANLAHTHTIAQVTGLQAALDTKETASDIRGKIEDHAKENAPHTYGGKYVIAFNPNFGTLDFEVIA